MKFQFHKHNSETPTPVHWTGTGRSLLPATGIVADDFVLLELATFTPTWMRPLACFLCFALALPFQRSAVLLQHVQPQVNCDCSSLARRVTRAPHSSLPFTTAAAVLLGRASHGSSISLALLQLSRFASDPRIILPEFYVGEYLTHNF